MKQRAAIALALTALLSATSLVTGCAKQEQAVVVTENAASENTGTVTPLERGKARREAMEDMRAFTDAWKAGDAEAMSKYLPEVHVKKFEKTWKGFEAQGLTIKHVHDVSNFDVTQFNKDATQATVTYTYKDKSYLVDKNGKKVRDLPVIEEDASITTEREDDKSTDWVIKRFFVAKESYR